jgi:pimeloyl-ACP methyl ester carboxylesterase
VFLNYRYRRTGARWLVLLGCCFIASAVVHASPLPVVVETVITEPVFHAKVHIYTAGQDGAPTVVLIHGLGDNGARDWDGLITVLARDFRVVAFDLPGFGHSSKGNELYSPENYTAFLRYLLVEHVRARTISLVGHSMGGAIALRYAARYPQDVTALVLVDVPGILHPMAYSKYISHLGIDFLPSLYPAQNDHLSNLVSSILTLTHKAQPVPEAIIASPQLRQSFLNAEPAKIAGLALALEDFAMPGSCRRICHTPSWKFLKRADTHPWKTFRSDSINVSRHSCACRYWSGAMAFCRVNRCVQFQSVAVHAMVDEVWSLKVNTIELPSIVAAS